MKIFTKRLALVTGLLFTALMCMGVVFIDSTSVFWQLQSGIVKLYVTNTIPVIMVDTNTQRIGIFSTNTTYAFEVLPRRPSTNGGATGQSSALIGGMNLQGADGGNTIRGTAATGGAGGTVFATGGSGGDATHATTNATGGVGGGFSFLAGTGGGTGNSIATNASTGGNGGAAAFSTGPGGSPVAPATNTVGGNGGTLTFTAGAGGVPTAGWARKSGNGANFIITAGSSGNSVRTNTGTGGNVTLTAGSTGNATTTPGGSGIPGAVTLLAGSAGSAVAGGNPSPGGVVTITAGDGNTGDTNSNGGRVHLVGGSPGSGAVAGDVVVARDTAGTSRGGLMVGPLVAGTAASLTNLLTITATLDFPSIAAGSVADMDVAFAGAADGDVVTLGVPLSAVTNCMWMAFASNAVVYVRAANGQLVTAQDPNSGVFRITVEKFR